MQDILGYASKVLDFGTVCLAIGASCLMLGILLREHFNDHTPTER